MKSPFRKNPIARGQEQEQKFLAAIAKAEAKIGLIEQEIEKHRGARRAHILETPDVEVSAELRHLLDIAERHLIVAREERDDMACGLDEVRKALAAANAEAERDAAAKVLELAAAGVDKAGLDLDTAIAGVARAVGAIMTAIPEDMATYRSDYDTRPFERGGGQFATPTEVAAALVAEALYEALPGLFDVQPLVLGVGPGSIRTHARQVVLYRMAEFAEQPRVGFRDGVPAGMKGSNAARSISAQWRERARAMRDGRLVADPSLIATDIPKQESASAEKIEVYVIKNFAYAENAKGTRQLCGRRWARPVPAVVADIAVAQGLALRTDTPEGKEAFEREKAHRAKGHTSLASGLSLAQCVDLGDPCGFLTGPDRLAAAE